MSIREPLEIYLGRQLNNKRLSAYNATFRILRVVHSNTAVSGLNKSSVMFEFLLIFIVALYLTFQVINKKI